MSDGTIHIVDMDLTCPMFKTKDVDQYDGTIDDYRAYLLNSKLLLWLEERFKLEASMSGDPAAIKSVKVKKVSQRKVVPIKVTKCEYYETHTMNLSLQSLVFLRKESIEEYKRQIYALMKLLKKLTNADVTR